MADPSKSGEMVTRKAEHFQVLLGLLKVLGQDRALDQQARSDGMDHVRAAIAKAEAILVGALAPEAGDKSVITDHIVEILGRCHAWNLSASRRARVLELLGRRHLARQPGLD